MMRMWKGESRMEIFNIFCGVCSIASLLLSLFAVGKVTKISKTYNCDNKNDHSKVINRSSRNTYNGSYVGRDSINGIGNNEQK